MSYNHKSIARDCARNARIACDYIYCQNYLYYYLYVIQIVVYFH